MCANNVKLQVFSTRKIALYSVLYYISSNRILRSGHPDNLHPAELYDVGKLQKAQYPSWCNIVARLSRHRADVTSAVQETTYVFNILRLQL